MSYSSNRERLENMLGAPTQAKNTWLLYGKDSQDPQDGSAWLFDDGQIGFFSEKGWCMVDSYEEYEEHIIGLLMDQQEQDAPYANEGRFEEHA